MRARLFSLRIQYNVTLNENLTLSLKGPHLHGGPFFSFKGGKMNSSEKENLAKSDRRTKVQLLQELSNAHNIMEEQEKELITLSKELENAKAKIMEFEEQKMVPVSMKDDLIQAQAELIDMKQQLEQLKQEVKKLKSIHEKDQEEKEVLKNQLRTAEEAIESERIEQRQMELREKGLAKAKAQTKELERKIRDLENKNKNLKEKITDLQKTEETIPEGSGASKAAFRIDLYPRQGHYQGKVEHLLSKEKKAFSGLDQKAITDFINKHLHQPEELVVTPNSVAPKPKAASVETQTPAFKTASTRKLALIRDGKMQKEALIPHDQAFQLALIVNPPKSIVEENVPCPYNISVYAKRMGGGLKQILGETSGQITSTEEFTANVPCVPLPAGIYRIVASGTSNIKKDRQEAIGYFQESSIFSVS